MPGVLLRVRSSTLGGDRADFEGARLKRSVSQGGTPCASRAGPSVPRHWPHSLLVIVSAALLVPPPPAARRDRGQRRRPLRRASCCATSAASAPPLVLPDRRERRLHAGRAVAQQERRLRHAQGHVRGRRRERRRHRRRHRPLRPGRGTLAPLRLAQRRHQAEAAHGLDLEGRSLLLGARQAGRRRPRPRRHGRRDRPLRPRPLARRPSTASSRPARHVQPVARLGRLRLAWLEARSSPPATSPATAAATPRALADVRAPSASCSSSSRHRSTFTKKTFWKRRLRRRPRPPHRGRRRQRRQVRRRSASTASPTTRAGSTSSARRARPCSSRAVWYDGAAGALPAAKCRFAVGDVTGDGRADVVLAAAHRRLLLAGHDLCRRRLALPAPRPGGRGLGVRGAPARLPHPRRALVVTDDAEVLDATSLRYSAQGVRRRRDAHVRRSDGAAQPHAERRRPVRHAEPHLPRRHVPQGRPASARWAARWW